MRKQKILRQRLSVILYTICLAGLLACHTVTPREEPDYLNRAAVANLMDVADNGLIRLHFLSDQVHHVHLGACVKIVSGSEDSLSLKGRVSRRVGEIVLLQVNAEKIELNRLRMRALNKRCLVIPLERGECGD